MATDANALPRFIREHADELLDPAAARGVALAYESDLSDLRSHPFYGMPEQQDERPSLSGPPTFQRISGRLDALFLAMQWLAYPLAGHEDHDPTWVPAALK